MRKKIKKTMIGGQALIEGLMMKGPEKTCAAIRKPDGEIHTEVTKTAHNPVRKIPFLRGPVAMILSLKEGYGAINKSAEIALTEEQQEEQKGKFDKWFDKTFGDKGGAVISVVAMILGVALAIFLFMMAPAFLVNLISSFYELGAFKTLVEGIIKIIIFIAYLFLITRMKDIHRVFEYHGAEHKTITCYEYGDELTVENVKKHSRFHPRCGTSFIFIVLIISIIIFSFITWGNLFVRVGLKILTLPVVMGISYEIIMFAGKYDNIFCRVVSAPGIWIQRLTTFEPDDEEIEVAITAFNAVAPQDDTDAV